MVKQKTCEERIKSCMEDRLDDIRKLWEAQCNGEEHIEDLGAFHEYGLSFDYVPKETFGDQEQGYFRYQLSWGGPSDEFRFFVDYEKECYRIEYWFLDWYDGASRQLYGEDLKLMNEIFNDFKECGMVESEFLKATMDE